MSDFRWLFLDLPIDVDILVVVLCRSRTDIRMPGSVLAITFAAGAARRRLTRVLGLGGLSVL